MAYDQERARAYYLANRDRRLAYDKAYRAANPEKCRLWNRSWKSRNRPKQAAAELAWRRRQPWHRPTQAIRQRIRLALEPGSRVGLVMRRLGYTAAELRAHLEGQFRDGMAWSNRGREGWHIDHRVPLCRFRYASLDDPLFLEAWALSNLQPLWWWENEAKGVD